VESKGYKLVLVRCIGVRDREFGCRVHQMSIILGADFVVVDRGERMTQRCRVVSNRAFVK
jgi:hypothetical protein